jgi:integrase
MPLTGRAQWVATYPAATDFAKALGFGDLVFPTATGRPVSPGSVWDSLRHACEAARLPPVRVDDLRHTHATMLLLAGAHPRVVQERPGHSQVGITLQTYSHVLPDLQGEAARKVGELLGKGPPERSPTKGGPSELQALSACNMLGQLGRSSPICWGSGAEGFDKLL